MAPEDALEGCLFPAVSTATATRQSLMMAPACTQAQPQSYAVSEGLVCRTSIKNGGVAGGADNSRSLLVRIRPKKRPLRHNVQNDPRDAGRNDKRTIPINRTRNPWEGPCWLLSTATSHSGSVLLPPNLQTEWNAQVYGQLSAFPAQLVLARSPRRTRLTLTVRAGFSSHLREFLTRDVGASGVISTPEVYFARHSRGGVKAESGRRSAGGLRGSVPAQSPIYPGWLGAFMAEARVERAPSGYSFSATIYILLVHTVRYPTCVHAGVSRYE
ncbi:hypothetical protein DFH09DRAFT_1079529 [Mycena vulgaris]|nr:hypothetical protein DFH09DRAFT_1079529 [Mycena vulgaris]